MSPINRYDENLVSLVAELHLYEEKIVLVNITTAYWNDRLFQKKTNEFTEI